MSLSKEDLRSIGTVVEDKLKPVIQRLDKIEKRLESLEAWLPTENTYIVSPIKNKAAGRSRTTAA